MTTNDDAPRPESGAEEAPDSPRAEVEVPSEALPAETAAAVTPETASPSQDSTPEPSDESSAPSETVEAEAISPADPAPAEETVAVPAASVEMQQTDAPRDPAVDEAMQAAAAAGTVKVGQRIKVKLVQVGEDTCFVDFGGRAEGSIAAAELKDKEGKPTHEIGAEFEAVVRSTGDNVVFTLGKKSGRPLKLKELQKAFEDKVPVEGTVRSVNKGGFDVRVRGARAFCPFSQIDITYCEKPEEYVGQKLPFQIITFERGGRNIVVSRRKILETEAASSAEETREKLSVGDVVEGTVRRLQPYGAFVDIGGIDGLLHVSEMGHGRVTDPSQALSVGSKVEVKVIKIEGLGTETERISLSRKELEPDPWASVENELAVGTTVEGTVVRITEFGAFVQIAPGVDGLVHVSELADHRVQHPKDEVSEGQVVEARVLRLDADQRRISLSMRDPSAEPASAPARSYESREARPSRSAVSGGPDEVTPEPDLPADMSYEDRLEALKRKFAKRA